MKIESERFRNRFFEFGFSVLAFRCIGLSTFGFLFRNRSLVEIETVQKYRMVVQGIEQGPSRFIEIKLLYKLEHH